jgi:hypothetical protein
VLALKDPEIVRLIRTGFIPLAIDATNHYFYQDAADRKFLEDDLNTFVVRTAGGKVLGTLGTAYRDSYPQEVKQLLRKTLANFTPGETAEVAVNARTHDLPEDVVVVNVTAKVLDAFQPFTLERLVQVTPETKKLTSAEQRGYIKYYDQMGKAFHSALGRDHLWIRKSEVEALCRGELPEPLKVRLARYHLEDFTRGQALFWPGANHVKKLQMDLKGNRLTGSVHVEDVESKRGFEGELLGFIEAKKGKLLRFDLVARGHYWGARNGDPFAVPGSKYQLGVAFTLGTGTHEAEKVPPNALLRIAGKEAYFNCKR